MIRRDPIGVVAQITPWNYPLMMAAWKLAPALAAGNTVVLKPSEQTPLTTLKLAGLLAEVFPRGVVNIVAGRGDSVGAPLIDHPGVRMISLTGSIATGQKVLGRRRHDLKRTHLELGGKAPVLVFDDADLEAVVAGVRMAGFYNAGQDCTAACRDLRRDAHLRSPGGRSRQRRRLAQGRRPAAGRHRARTADQRAPARAGRRASWSAPRPPDMSRS